MRNMYDVELLLIYICCVPIIFSDHPVPLLVLLYVGMTVFCY